MIAIDTDILIDARRGETELHEAAAARLVALAEGVQRWALPIVCCVAEFMRVVTHRRVFGPPSTVTQAAAFAHGIAASPSCEVVQPGPEFVGHLLESALAANAQGNLMFDAQIAALCRGFGVDAILTSDRDFERFEGPRTSRLD